MSRNLIKLIIEPSILKYARFCSGYDISEVAKSAGIKNEKLISWESGKSEISIAQLKKLAGIYKFPLAYFFLQEKPKDAILPENFRIIYSSDKFSFSPAMMLAIRRARYAQSVIQELSEDEIKYNFQSITLSADIEAIASHFRSVLGVSVDDQNKLLNPALALRYWKDKVEALNIFVLQRSLPNDDVDAFCLADQTPYVITLNSAEHENRRVFSLFHEIGHILLHISGVCTPNDLSRNSFEYVKVEKFCNQFAASLLVPYDDFMQHHLVKKIKGLPFSSWESEDIRVISNYFRVSQEVIYRRLVTVGILENRKYEEKRAELIKGFQEYKKRKKIKDLPIPQFRKVISNNGRAYSMFILDNLYSEKITFADAADYLDTNSRHILDIESHV